ncbi:hypothetical protein RCO48_07975 [Peribacillus frigoritolerans]|nr:hypothetical protein [Peribacillus frigoritolerans]
MDLSLSDELYQFSQELQRYLSPEALQELAKEVKLVQRDSKFGAKHVVALSVWTSQKVANTPLALLCSHLESSTGVLMSPQALPSVL